MSVTEEQPLKPLVGAAPERSVVLEAAEEGRGPARWHCLEFWRATPELLSLPKEVRVERVIEELLVSSDGPFPEGALQEPAPLTWRESAAVQAFFLLVMGGPVVLVVVPFVALVLRSWQILVGWAVVVVVLAAHPLPGETLETSTFTLACYKYFSYRWIWVDDQVHRRLGSDKAWCAAGVPHGVLPIGNWLAGIASNAFVDGGKFVAGVASVVPYTPFLRYLCLFGEAISVSAANIRKETERGNCVGIIADGIAGIFSKEYEVALKNRKGLAKLSLQAGFPVVPVYSVGNAQAYCVCHDPCGILKAVSRFLRVSLFLFWGRLGPIPRRCNITTMFGPPAMPMKVSEKPSQEAVDELHEEILQGIRVTFDQHKAACGLGNRELTFT